ncbi:transmembrane protein 192 isoform X1 [Erpetoichthys calabaricus]|uniref:Transmembrane protein 192 n=2 Tax=Erpetoichthys calabaricus TaxID=27687 RepID=A0A8C4S390_ERPCA|nr:transmembrane protein 192 isoform X1 [Erpetoichthys calabaricus]
MSRQERNTGMAARGATAGITPSMEITQSLEEDPLIDGPIVPNDLLDSAIRPQFKSLHTSWIAILLLLLHVSFTGLSFVLIVFCTIKEKNAQDCKEYIHDFDTQTIVCIGKVSLWLIFAVFERYVQHQHSQTRNRGYLLFYRSTRHLKHLPLLILSTGNAALLLILSVKRSFDRDDHLYTYLIFGVLALELFFSALSLIIYAVKVCKFNNEKPAPDISQEERSNTYSSSRILTSTETGFRDSSSLEEVVEKQADLIEYLKQHNTLLSKRLLSIAAQQIRY